MNGAQDLGGMMGFGPIASEADEPWFHAEWERRVFALTLAMGATGAWNLDQSRHARESLDPARYLASSYYEIWFEGLCRLMRERGLVTAREIEEGSAVDGPKPLKRKLAAGDVAKVLSAGGPTSRQASAAARFAPGDAVRARNMHPLGHTRLPRYLRGHAGKIVAVRGAHVFPDSHAQGDGENPQWLYTVRFSARTIWGEGRNPNDSVHADLFEPYLDAA
ncbi:MAG: nitrile hydratase subunit beta [Parvibaculaceae bacterium]